MLRTKFADGTPIRVVKKYHQWLLLQGIFSCLHLCTKYVFIIATGMNNNACHVSQIACRLGSVTRKPSISGYTYLLKGTFQNNTF